MKYAIYLLLRFIVACGIISVRSNAGEVGFAGQVLNGSDAIFMRARVYDPEIGSFLSKDPLGVRSSLHAYAYVNSNPVNYIDPKGEIAETVWDIFNIGLGAASFADNVSNGSYGWATLSSVCLPLRHLDEKQSTIAQNISAYFTRSVSP